MTDTAITRLRLADPDAAFRELVQAHRGLSETGSAALNARLVLVLMNAVGDMETVRAAIRLARETGPAGSSCETPQMPANTEQGR
jgi:hypothetical protein